MLDGSTSSAGPAPDADQPPYSNRGVIPPGALTKSDEAGPDFDAYNATVYAQRDLLGAALLDALQAAGYAPRVERGPKVTFYDENALFLDDKGHRILSIRSGGANFHPFVECKGPASPLVAATLRNGFDHKPSRVDSALDLRGPDVWAQLCAICDRMEEVHGVQLNERGAKRDHPHRGSTIYLGSRSSRCFVRVYQKGLKTAEEMGLVGDAIPDELRHWVRCELELKPDKPEGKRQAAKLSARGMWGCSPWTRVFATLAFAIDAEKVKMSEKRESDHERAMRYLIQQYGPTIRKHVELCGSWARFCDDLHERLENVCEPA